MKLTDCGFKRANGSWPPQAAPVLSFLKDLQDFAVRLGYDRCEALLLLNKMFGARWETLSDTRADEYKSALREFARDKEKIIDPRLYESLKNNIPEYAELYAKIESIRDKRSDRRDPFPE